ncbi:MAG TPA: molybdopterin cofactor-binding domain-containing protein, partial [Mycobacterium sp.]|nr:molybdopterin cofactor-binding domain-containing protein [Mycobacterium sp.]
AKEIHPDWPGYELLAGDGARKGNVSWEATVVRGDVDAAFARDDVIVVETLYRAGRQNQTAFEPRAVLASYERGRFVITTSTQVPWSVRSGVARMVGVQPSDVRVIVPPVGGGFGMKWEMSLEPFAALLARETGRPVRLVNSRQEEQQTALCRENAEIRIRSAITSGGEIVGREGIMVMDCGGYSGEQPFLCSMVTHTLLGSYKLGSARLVSQSVYTNTPPTGAFRACCGTYCVAALERHTDEICAQMGFDPFDFRRKNVIGDGDLGPTGHAFEGDVLGPMLDRMKTLRESTTRHWPTTDRIVCGTSTTVGTWFIFVGPSAATVNLNPDGTATLVTAAVEIGSGSTMQAIPQIVADALQIPFESVYMREADTDAAGYDGGVGGGRTTVSIGAASASAAAEVKRKVLDLTAEMLEVSVADLVLRDGRVEVDGVPSMGVTIQEVAAHAQSTTGPISGSGAFTGVDAQPMAGCAAGHYVGALDLPVFAVQETNVAVDLDTGHVTILDYRVVQDVGRAINPHAIEGQIQGGVTQGFGYALHEEITFDNRGNVRQQGFETYRIPLAGDTVPVQIDLYEGAPSMGPLGAKGAGEVPILNVAAAISCAVANAIGKPVFEIPLTPERVLSILLDRPGSSVDLPHLETDWRRAVIGGAENLLAKALG